MSLLQQIVTLFSLEQALHCRALTTNADSFAKSTNSWKLIKMSTGLAKSTVYGAKKMLHQEVGMNF